MNNINSHKDTLIQLYKSSKAIALRTESKYKELTLFREEIEVFNLKSHKLPFTAAKSKVRLYQAIFVIFTVLFLFLAKFVALTTLSFPLIFGAGAFFTLRNLLVGFCLLASIGALSSAFLMTAAREAAHQVRRQALMHLYKHKMRKKMEWNLVEYFQWKICKKTNLLRDAYQDADEKIRDACEETLHLLKRIGKTNLAVAEKETLYNQALLEYGDKGRAIVREFRKTKPPASLPAAP